MIFIKSMLSCNSKCIINIKLCTRLNEVALNFEYKICENGIAVEMVRWVKKTINDIECTLISRIM